jgi:hypothetical protein
LGGAAAWVGNTGYGYGVNDAVALSEQLMLYFTQEMGTQQFMPLGQALVNAKQRYAFTATSGGFGVYDEKAMIEATFYGLPMHTVRTPLQPDAIGGFSINEGTPAPLYLNDPEDLWVVNHIVNFTVPEVPGEPSPQMLHSTEDGSFYSQNYEVQAWPGRPIQPRGSFVLPDLETPTNVNLVPHGQFLVGASFSDIGNFDPVVAIPSSEDTLLEPLFSADGWFPVKLWAVNRFGDQDRSTLVAGQYDSNNETERLYNMMELETFYAPAGWSDYEPPVIWSIVSDIVEVEDTSTTPPTLKNVVHFAALVGDASDIPARVIATYTVFTGGVPSGLQAVELVQDPYDPALWVYDGNTIVFEETMEYYIQAVDASGNVAISSKEAFHVIDGEKADAIQAIGTQRTIELEFAFDDGGVQSENVTFEISTMLVGAEDPANTCNGASIGNGSCSVTITSVDPGVSTLTITFRALETVNGEVNVIVEQTFEYITEWWAGSITLPKSVAFGSATSDLLDVCYTLSRIDGGGPLVTTSKDRQCPEGGIDSGDPQHTFEWEGLTAGTYQLVEEVNDTTYTFMQPITDIVVDDAHPDVQLQTVVNQLEGCSPGYWRNHLDRWDEVGLDPADPFDVVFDFINSPISSGFGLDFTLEDAVNAKGGNRNALARHGIAALLSALHADVLYPLEADGIQGSVIDLVQSGMEARASSVANLLASANSLSCPIN